MICLPGDRFGKSMLHGQWLTSRKTMGFWSSTVDMDVIAIWTQTDVESQFIPGATLQDRIVCRRSDGDRTCGIGCPNRTGYSKQGKTYEQTLEMIHDYLLKLK